MHPEPGRHPHPTARPWSSVATPGVVLLPSGLRAPAAPGRHPPGPGSPPAELVVQAPSAGGGEPETWPSEPAAGRSPAQSCDPRRRATKVTALGRRPIPSPGARCPLGGARRRSLDGRPHRVGPDPGHPGRWRLPGRSPGRSSGLACTQGASQIRCRPPFPLCCGRRASPGLGPHPGSPTPSAGPIVSVPQPTRASALPESRTAGHRTQPALESPPQQAPGLGPGDRLVPRPHPGRFQPVGHWLEDGPPRVCRGGQKFIRQTIFQYLLPPGPISLHPDRGRGLCSQLVAFPLAAGNVTKTHPRACLSDHQPYSQGQCCTRKDRPQFPHRFGCLQQARAPFSQPATVLAKRP